MFRSIRWRIAIPYILLILLVMLVIGVFVSGFVRQTYLDQLESQLVSEARLASESLAPVLSSPNDFTGTDVLADRWSELLTHRVTIIAADGTVVGESHEDITQMENHLNRPEVQQAIEAGQGSSIRFSQTIRSDMLYTAVPVEQDGSLLGFVRFAEPLDAVESTIAHLQQTLMAAAVIATVLILLLAMFIAGRTTRPLRQLTAAAVQISSGDLEGRIVPTTSDEVGRLTHAFNAMSAQLNSQIKALESERSKMAAVLSEMTDGVLIVDGNGRVQLVNSAAESIFEVRQPDALGRSLAEVVRNHQVVDLWQLSQSTGKTQASTVEFPARRLYLQIVATSLGEALPGSILLLFQDLTRIRRLETVRRDFISNISHELRTPLASLKALTETLQEGALDDPPAARRFLQRIETEVDALSLMVTELLELSRIESGRVSLKMRPTSPEAMVQVVVERLRLQAERAGLTLTTEVSDNLPEISVDRERLEGVLLNLVHNAIKFTPPGGSIQVRVWRQDQRILFAVQDTGIGIRTEDLQRIFERFYKADRSRAGGGTGLGLAIARHQVEAHGGRIWVESTEGQGSSFYFSIPLGEPQQKVDEDVSRPVNP